MASTTVARMWVTMIAGTVLAVSGGAWAAGVTISAADGAGGMVVEADDASVDELLAEIAKMHGFTVTRSAGSSPPRRFSGRMQGTIDAVLDRILRNDGFIIVRSETDAGRISRIVLFGSQPRPASFLVPGIGLPIAAPRSETNATVSRIGAPAAAQPK